jgi:hypothetical protein
MRGGGASRVAVGNRQSYRPLETPRCKWEDDIKVDVEKIGWKGAEWMNLAEDRDKCRAVVNTAMNVRVP